MKKADIDIAGLARLARLEVSTEELARLEREIPAILSFVETIQQAKADATPATPATRNVMRADEAPHERGVHTKALLESAPGKVGDRIAVQQVISRNKA